MAGSNKFTISGIQANFFEDAAAIGEMSPYLIFDGDNDASADKHGVHVSKTETAKKAGAGPVTFEDRLTLHVKGSQITVAGVASKALLPDKRLGEGQVQISGSGRQTVQLISSKSGVPVGEVSFQISPEAGLGQKLAGHGTGAGVGTGVGGTGGQHGNTNQYGNTGTGNTGVGGAGQYGNTGTGQYDNTGNTGTGQYGNTGTGQYGNTGAGQYGNTGVTNTGNTGGGQLGNTGGAGYGQNPNTGATGTGMGGQEHYEKKGHSTHDHDESESYETRTRQL